MNGGGEELLSVEGHWEGRISFLKGMCAVVSRPNKLSSFSRWPPPTYTLVALNRLGESKQNAYEIERVKQ